MRGQWFCKNISDNGEIVFAQNKYLEYVTDNNRSYSDSQRVEVPFHPPNLTHTLDHHLPREQANNAELSRCPALGPEDANVVIKFRRFANSAVSVSVA